MQHGVRRVADQHEGEDGVGEAHEPAERRGRLVPDAVVAEGEAGEGEGVEEEVEVECGDGEGLGREEGVELGVASEKGGRWPSAGYRVDLTVERACGGEREKREREERGKGGRGGQHAYRGRAGAMEEWVGWDGVASTNVHVCRSLAQRRLQTHPSKDAVVEAEPVSVRDVRGTNVIRTTSCDLGRGHGLPFGGGACHRGVSAGGDCG